MEDAGEAARAPPRADAGRDRDSPGGEEDPLPRQEADGEDAEGVLPERADAGHPEGAGWRRARRVQERDSRDRREAQDQADEQRGHREGQEGAQEAQDDAPDERGSDRRAQLHRLDPRRCPGTTRPKSATTSSKAEKILDEDHYGLQEDQGAHPRVPRGAGAHEEAQGPDPLLRRPARRRQDEPREEHRARDGPQVRAPVARRRARRGRDPRPPPHVHRRAARQAHPVAEEGRHEQPGLPARRDRQDVDRLPRRSGGGAARGARPRAEPRVQRSLPRSRLRPLRRDVHHDGEHAAAASRCRCRTAWRSSSSPATPSSRS